MNNTAISLAPSWHPLNCVDEFILACGWTYTAQGFVPPAEWMPLIAPLYGSGRYWTRQMAAQFCIQYHETKSPIGNRQSEIQS